MKLKATSRFLGLALVILSASAGLAHAGSTTAVSPPTTPPVPAGAIITCTAVNGAGGVLGQPVVNNVDFSLGLVIPSGPFANVQTGVNCAVALQTLAELGFTRQDSNAAMYAGAGDLTNTGNGGVIFTWTYTLPNEQPLL